YYVSSYHFTLLLLFFFLLLPPPPIPTLFPYTTLFRSFDCSMGDRPIHYMGHVRMMAAAQPFISGAISKTINMPEHATVEEVEQMFVEGWRLGLKAVAIYRDNCKVAQPLAATKKASAKE